MRFSKFAIKNEVSKYSDNKQARFFSSLHVWMKRERRAKATYASKFCNGSACKPQIIGYFCNMGTLYLVPTPVGNLEDMTLRGIRVLKEADLILAEDTRTSGLLLKHFDIQNHLQSYHKFNEHQVVRSLVMRLKAGLTVALVSDAGTPSVSDPGFLLVRECMKEGVGVCCLPGATAFVPALVSSGLPCERFVFEGFLPQKKGRQTRIEALREETRTMIFYESPYRVLRALKELSAVFGPDREAATCREISKVHEETLRGTLEELIAHYEETEPRGEFVLLVAGKKEYKHSKTSKQTELS